MARPTSPILAADTGRAQSAALVILAVLASLQVLLVFRSVWLVTAADANGQGVAASSTSVAGTGAQAGAATGMAGLVPPEPGQLAGSTAMGGSPAVAMASMSAPPVPGQLAGMEAPAAPAGNASVFSPAPTAAVDPELAELLDTVRQLRPLGDTAGMLEVLKRCELLAPSDPQVLHEFALTYEQMGLGDKAVGYWQRLGELGPERAGSLYPLAVSRLQNAPAPSTTTPGLTGPAGVMPLSAADGTVLAIGPCEVVKDRAVTEGERAILRIPIQRTSEGFVEPTAVSVDVFFFDIVNDSTVEQTRADPPVSSWVAAPVDWAGEGIEPLDVIYSLPKMSAEEVKNHGKRSFYGYVVKLYYQNKLQATTANPPDLLSGDPTAAASNNPAAFSDR